MIDQPAAIIPGLDAAAGGAQVLAGLHRISAPERKGCHDSDLCIADGRAYVVFMANSLRLGEQPDWPEVAIDLVVIDLASGRIASNRTIAASGQRYGNVTLPHGACFLPRLVRVDAGTLRCFFTSEDPAKRQSQYWRLDLDLPTGAPRDAIHPALLETVHGVLPMQPQHFHQHLAARGATPSHGQHGLYLIDGIKQIDGRNVAVLCDFVGGQMTLCQLDEALERFTIVAELPNGGLRLCEAAINRLPDGSWLAIARRDEGDANYRFATSPDGRDWSEARPWGLVPNGAGSKANLERFGDWLLLGWSESTRVDGAVRSVFNIDISRDGRRWYRRFRFASPDSFQYAVFRLADGVIWMTVTQGPRSEDHHSGKGRIMFGRLASLDELGAGLGAA